MRKLLFFITVFCLSLHAYAAPVKKDWKQATQFLPPYCKDRAKGINSTEFSRWKRTLGDAYIHAHHYCNGVYAEQMARGTTNQAERRQWVSTVLGEMAYVSRHCGPRCPLYPEMHSRWAWALSANGQPVEAIEHYQMVIKARPRYAPTYVKMSEIYIDLKQPDAARKVLDQGLKLKPDSELLQKRRATLGGGG